ncbi:MAG: UDP-N-acetylmuramoylalanyl-D-glutamate--L-lysine ligase [uncultured Rubrobacteraceae bacterium]|uniref:UDP-N-acetylmuramyl-tripeptide synthetase n=1 Tax=uncultured Rubrobacteraceae bacterium TaxID=349277 RepID=A0A6J4Q8Q3_9ACTN|nr:MAG: UDP-N-acetylmuramoylalanyl-D-glutamate--L-lysine ligase [uncultured Rubrobacteraceae bacterium]
MRVPTLATLRVVVSVLRAQLARILGTEPPPGVEGVGGVTHDSRLVEPGFAFVAIPGYRRDGTEFIPEALRRGAALIVAERGLPPGVPAVVVPDARAALAALARAVFGEPSVEMSVYGVTGTNGKTTTSYALYSILAAAYAPEKCGLMTTAEVLFGGERRTPARTTPEATEVQGTLREMLDAGVEHTVLEVSSHGVALKRVTGTRFVGALFTNLTRDHLDLHGSMEEYYRAKRELFRWVGPRGPKLANVDDPYGRRIAEEIPGMETFGVAEDADYRVEGVRSARGGTAFLLRHPGGVLTVESPLLGGYNVENVAGAAALALALGVGEEALEQAVREMGQVPGRFERVVPGGRFGFEVIVDYAHTDVALDAALNVARGVADAGGGRVLCVFGAAGDRDVAKRPLMGRVASKLAESSIITTDDTYTEDPEKIAREVAAGSEGGRYEVVLDRRAAIRRALEAARPGDVVVVAGKGHERVQHLPGGDAPFHDASVVRELLEELEREDD